MNIPSASEFFIAGFESSSLQPKEIKLLEQKLGGVILFKHNIESLEQIVDLNAAIINALPDFPPLLSVDQEGGRVARLRGICTDIPPLLLLSDAFLRDEHFCYRLAAMQARELVALGFHLNFAPVCDVLSNNLNEVIGDRAFSKDPNQTAQWASVYIRGLQGAGIAACAKHFPGHGRTDLDSHLALPIINNSFDEITATELIPFKAAIKADVATVMTAHIITKCIDDVPATLSHKTLSELLRGKLGFSGVVISDDLDMKAVADHYTLQEIIENGIFAGVDMFIIGNNFDKTKEAIAILDRLAKTNATIRDKLLASQQRIHQVRNRYIGKPLAPDLATAKTIIRCPPHLELMESCR